MSPRRAAAFGAAVLALATAPVASAHVVANPNYVQAGTEANVSLASPNERDKPMTGFVVTVPEGLEVVHAHGPAGWNVTSGVATARWTDGSLAPGAQTAFGVLLRATGSPGTISMQAEQRYADGVVRWPVTLTITPGAKSPSQNLALAGVVGVIGLLLIAIVGALAWRRRADSASA